MWQKLFLKKFELNLAKLILLMLSSWVLSGYLTHTGDMLFMLPRVNSDSVRPVLCVPTVTPHIPPRPRPHREWKEIPYNDGKKY